MVGGKKTGVQIFDKERSCMVKVSEDVTHVKSVIELFLGQLFLRDGSSFGELIHGLQQGAALAHLDYWKVRKRLCEVTSGVSDLVNTAVTVDYNRVYVRVTKSLSLYIPTT